MSALGWCIECWQRHRLRSEAVKLVDEDPYCKGCIVRLGLQPDEGCEAAQPRSSEDLQVSTASAVGSSEGSLGSARNGMDSSLLATPDAAAPRNEVHETKGENVMAKPQFDFDAVQKLRDQGLPMKQIADRMGCSVANIYYKLKQREQALDVVAGKPTRKVKTAKAEKGGRGESPEPLSAGRVSQNGKHAPGNEHSDDAATVSIPFSVLDSWWRGLAIGDKARLFVERLTQLAVNS